MLWTPRGAARARRFYEREGWRLTGREHARSHSGLPTVEYGRLTTDGRLCLTQAVEEERPANA